MNVASELVTVGGWVQASVSGNCVQMGKLTDGRVAIRDSKDPDGPALFYTPAEIAAMVDGAKAGVFDEFTK